MAHLIAFYVHPGHQLLDLAGPLDAFRAANAVAGQPLYDMRVLSLRGGPVTYAVGHSVDGGRGPTVAVFCFAHGGYPRRHHRVTALGRSPWFVDWADVDGKRRRVTPPQARSGPPRNCSAK